MEEFAAAAMASSAKYCLEELRDAKDCSWLNEASDQGVQQLNNMLNVNAPLEPIKILDAMDKPVAGPYQKHLIELQVNVAPKSNCSTGTCDFNLHESATYQLLLALPSTGTKNWTLIDSLQVDGSDIPVRDEIGAPEAASSHSVALKFLPPYAVEFLVVAACIFGLTVLLVHTVRARRVGYSTLGGRPHAQVHKQVRRIDLKRANPVPRDEEKVLRHSHEKNERFAV
ncbi:hypothetical protein LEN26_000115 [Aphanomyces euteiches]|nr:hypothetical protein AeMF1_000014 [Aphanomyces euteiches]KAH9164310.1 hypothetical protein LEN26_000115 [Aphanomyces euteiches]